MGDKSIISVDVKNIGGIRGSYNVVLRINGKVIDSIIVMLNSSQSRKVELNFIPEKEGVYHIDVEGLTGSLEAVKQIEKPSIHCSCS